MMLLWLLTTGCGASWEVLDGDGDGVTVLQGDCDDSNPDAAAGANQLWYPDEDGDGAGDPDSPAQACSPPAGYVSDGGDCDDTRLDIYPGASELCDGLDNDCDGEIDDNPTDPDIFFPDADGDGYGNEAASTAACDPPEGYITDGTDCDDFDASVFPGSTAQEVPGDGTDTDCDGNDFCTDLSCDGLPDLILANQYDGDTFAQSLSLFLNTGSRLHSEPVSLAAEHTEDVVVGDFDGDGYPDIAAASGAITPDTTKGSVVFWGSATGHSSDDRTELTTPGAVAVIAADLDGDALPELVFANHESASGFETASMIFWASPTGFTEADRTDLLTLGASDVVAADLDSDGAVDLVFCNHQTNSGFYSLSSTIYWGGDFSQSRSLPVDGCSGVTASDLDSDGRLDLIFASYRNNNTAASRSMIYWGDSDRFGTATVTELPTEAAESVQAADLDGDGIFELVFGSQIDNVEGDTHSTAVRIYWGQSGGTYSADQRIDLAANASIEPHIADLDGNGYLDLVAPGYAVGSDYGPDSYVYWGSSSGLSESDRTVLSTDNAIRATSGDLDGDGAPELVFASLFNGCTDKACSDLDFDTISRVYRSDGEDYSDGDVQLLTTTGVWAAPIIVGE